MMTYNLPVVESAPDEETREKYELNREERDTNKNEKEEKTEYQDSEKSNDKSEDTKEETENEMKGKNGKQRFKFNIADGGFTELHTLWMNEHKALLPSRENDVWHRKHDYWLLAGIIKYPSDQIIETLLVIFGKE